MKAMRIFGFVALLGLVFVLANCGGDKSVSPDRVLNIGLITEPESLDAHKARSIQAADVLRDIGEGLLGYSSTGELLPGAAASWQVSVDGLTYTFKIRENARWSNGDTLTAGHFEFGFERLVNPETAAFYADFLADIKSVEAPDDTTLVISMQRPTPYLLSLLTHPATFPMHPDSLAEHGDGFARPGKLLSNGAYVLIDWVPGSVITLRRNEQYWNNASTAIDEVRHHVLTQEMTQLARFRAGEIDITASVPSDSFQQIRAARGSQLHVAPYLGVYYYGFNLTKPPFKGNLKLRQALSMAIDRDLLVEKVTGRGELAAYSWVPPGVENYQPTQLSYAPMTQEERNAIARQLYKEAGYSDVNPLQLELRYNTSDAQRRVAVAVQAMWKEALGVETSLINEEFQVLIANVRARDVTQVFRSSWIGDYNDAHTFLSVLQQDSPANQPGYASEDFDSLMALAAEQVDLDRRRLYLEEAERLMLAEHPVIPIYFYVSKHLVSPRVEGWGDNVLDYHYSHHLSLKAAQ